MFRYFPTNYVWNLSVDLAIEMGAKIGEIEEMCAPPRYPACPGWCSSASWVTKGTWWRNPIAQCALAELPRHNHSMTR